MNLRIRVHDLWRALLKRLGFNTYLCGSCRYNNAQDCRHRVRPRATICEDYRRR